MRKIVPRSAYQIGLLLCVLTLSARAESPASPVLPEPLTLQDALALADEPHPELTIAEARLQAAEATIKSAAADTDLDIYLNGALRYVEPPAYSPDQTHDDNTLTLSVDKTLYDFGRSAASVKAATERLTSVNFLKLDTRQKRRLDIMQRFFEVVLADLQFYRYNEEMAVEFIALDRLRDQRELGQVSDIAVMQQEAIYQRVRHLRFSSQNQQRASRARLALALNRPGKLPATVVPPALPQVERTLPEVEQLQILALDNNPVLAALRSELVAAEAQVASARANDNPVLRGKLEAGTFSRERSSYDDWRAELSVKIPLYDGDRTQAAVALEKARLYELQSRLMQSERAVQQQVLELWLQLDALQSQREQRQAESTYRELYLDRSRALYEMEVKTDLGDSMVRISEAEHDARATDYEIALTWAKLEALTGRMNLADPLQAVPMQPAGQPQ